VVATAKRASRCARVRTKDHVYPIVRGVVGVNREAAAAAIQIYAVCAAVPVRRSAQGAIGHTGSREIGRIDAEMRGIGMIGRYVVGVRRDGDRFGKIYLLPARGGFVRECCRCKQCTAAGPQVAHVGSGVQRTLVEANAIDVAAVVRAKSHAEFHWRVGTGINLRGYRRARPKRRKGAVARSTRGAWRESDIHPIVRGAVGIRGEAATRAVAINSVWGRSGVCEGMQRRVIGAGRRKVAVGDTVVIVLS